MLDTLFKLYDSLIFYCVYLAIHVFMNLTQIKLK